MIYGINITGVTKGSERGRRAMTGCALDQIRHRSDNMSECGARVCRGEYARDKSGALVERYLDGDDHSIDAVAYGNREHIYRSRRTSNVSGKGRDADAALST